MSFKPLTQKERDDATVDYLRKTADRIESGEVLVEEFSANVDFEAGGIRTRTLVIKEYKPRN